MQVGTSKKRAGEDLLLFSPTRRRFDDFSRPAVDHPPAEPQPADAMVDDAGEDKPPEVRDVL